MIVYANRRYTYTMCTYFYRMIGWPEVCKFSSTRRSPTSKQGKRTSKNFCTSKHKYHRLKCFTHHSFTQHSFTRSQSYTFTVLYITVLHIYSLQDWPTNRIHMGSNDRPTLFKFDDGRWTMEIDGYNNSRKSIRNLFIQWGHHELLIKKVGTNLPLHSFLDACALFRCEP